MAGKEGVEVDVAWASFLRQTLLPAPCRCSLITGLYLAAVY